MRIFRPSRKSFRCSESVQREAEAAYRDWQLLSRGNPEPESVQQHNAWVIEINRRIERELKCG